MINYFLSFFDEIYQRISKKKQQQQKIHDQ